MSNVAVGEGADWQLSWSTDGRRASLRMFAGGEVQQLRSGEPLPAFAVTGSVAWGMVAADVVAVRLGFKGGTVSEVAVMGPDLDGRVAFVVELQDGQPATLAAIDRCGIVLQDMELEPSFDPLAELVGHRVSIRPVTRDGGPRVKYVVGEGSVDDVAWEYGVQVDDGELYTSWESHSSTGGGGGCAAGPMPEVAPGRLQVKGTGSSGDIWHLEVIGDASVASAVLLLATGEAIELPALGRDLDLGVIFFSVGLPLEARAVLLDGLETSGEVAHRLWLAGAVSWLTATTGGP